MRCNLQLGEVDNRPVILEINCHSLVKRLYCFPHFSPINYNVYLLEKRKQEVEKYLLDVWGTIL